MLRIITRMFDGWREEVSSGDQEIEVTHNEVNEARVAAVEVRKNLLTFLSVTLYPLTTHCEWEGQVI